MAKLKVFNSVKEFTGKVLDLDDYDSWLITFKNRLKIIIINERKNQNLSQSDLADLLQTTQSVISRIESGLSRNITIDYLLKIITVLGMSPEKVMKEAA